ncbi:MAG TPA: oligosaccharide flippase family protein [Blastocatellia bacterium]|nr:oligosaccharide flippase family protein [Blastocatellia bacterium]
MGETTTTIYDKIAKTIKHTLIFQIGGLANSAYGFLLLPLYVRHINTKEYGILALLIVALTFLTILFRFGLNQSFFAEYYQTDDPKQRKEVVGSALIFLVLACAAGLMVLYPFSRQISALILGGDETRTWLMQLVLVDCFFEVITLIPDSILRANFKSARYSALNVVALAVQLAAISYIVLRVDPSANGVIVGRLIGSVFEAALFFWAVRQDLSLHFSSARLKSMLAFGSPLILGQLLSMLFVMIDRFFVVRYTSVPDVGVYALSNQIVMVIAILITGPFGQVWNVMRFSVMKEKGAEEYYSRVLTYIVLASMFLAVCVAAVAGDGLILEGLRSYWPCATIVPLLALASVFDNAGGVLNVGITLRKRTIYSPIVTGTALAVNIALNFLLIPRYGIMGASISTLLSYIAFCGVRFSVSNLFIKIQYDWTRVFTSTAVGGSVILIFYSIDYLRGVSPSRGTIYMSLGIKTCLALLFPLMLYAIGFYEQAERKRIREFARTLYVLARRAAGTGGGSSGPSTADSESAAALQRAELNKAAQGELPAPKEID